jgi:hypothetical protein
LVNAIYFSNYKKPQNLGKSKKVILQKYLNTNKTLRPNRNSFSISDVRWAGKKAGQPRPERGSIFLP